MNIDSDITRDAPAIATLRRDLHAHPELSSEEVRTAGVVQGKLIE